MIARWLKIQLKIDYFYIRFGYTCKLYIQHFKIYYKYFLIRFVNERKIEKGIRKFIVTASFFKSNTFSSKKKNTHSVIFFIQAICFQYHFAHLLIIRFDNLLAYFFFFFCMWKWHVLWSFSIYLRMKLHPAFTLCTKRFPVETLMRVRFSLRWSPAFKSFLGEWRDGYGDEDEDRVEAGDANETAVLRLHHDAVVSVECTSFSKLTWRKLQFKA